MGAAKKIQSPRLNRREITENHKKVLKHFAIMWVLTAVGMCIGAIVPPVVALIASIMAIVLLLATAFIEELRSTPFIYHFVPFLLGIGLWFSTSFYMNALGAGNVLAIFIGTIILFSTLGFIGNGMGDISGWGKYLLFGLFGIILFTIIGVFIGSNLFTILLAGAGIVLFSLYTMYDFNQMAYYKISDVEAPAVALGLYLDFINLFLDILRLVWASVTEFDLFD